HLIPDAPVAAPGHQVPPEALAAHAAWVKGSKEIVVPMLMTMDLDIQRNLEHLGAYDMLQELKTLFAQQAEQELLQTVREFHACKQEEGQSVSSYVLKMKSYIENLECLGHPVSLNLAVSLILVSLSKEYDSFVQNYNMHNMGKTVNELHAMIKLHEQMLPKKDDAPALYAIRAGKYKPAYAPKPKIPPPPKKGNPAKDAICHQCGEVGIFTIELYSFPSTSWVYDTGCGTHICNTTQGLMGSKKLKLGALSLYMGNGQRAVVEAIGNFHLCLPSGLIVILNNCNYAPSITRGIISVSCLYDDGFVNRFENNEISVSRNNLVYFCAIPRDGIYEIDLSFTNTNDSSIKKRIEKLQYDGLLNSTDIKYFEKCVSCMSGKMARKPYSHQVERAKDILGLIHTDVCSPFRTVSRQGASYFVTFTNDFSRYGYVYLLKHKHKVFETFKMFQKEVENQLGKTIKSLRSDRGGEYMKASGSLEYLEIIQVEDTQPSIDTISHHDEDDQEIDEPQSDINPIRRSTRTRRAPDRMCLYIDAEEHKLGDLGEPANYKAALLDPESDKWLDAMNVEMQSLKDNKVWDLVDLPPNGKTNGSKWLFKKKTDMDYEETFSPIADIRAIRILIAIAAFYDYEIWQIDIKTTFLNGHLSEEVYMVQPKGFVNLKYHNRVCKLKRSVYGLKQASRQWNKRFDDEIKKFSFSQNHDEPCVYMNASRSYVTFLILYVDDILIMGNKILMLQDVKSNLGRCFAMKDLGESTYILGIKIYRDRSRRLIGLC
ncbi:retrotransposon protein, putative, ty1-copia subclass, partial [Tanacetum coccineum]